MNMDVLGEFLALAETCSFQKAAVRLHISQSSLSKHMKKLEEELCCPLFERTTRSVTLTGYGRALYPRARRMAEEWNAARAELATLAETARRAITVAYAPALTQYGLIETLSAFSEAHPEIELHTRETYRPGDLLKTGGCDFAFTVDDDTPGFCRRVYRTDRLTAVFPPDHPLASRTSIAPEELKEERFILHVRQNGPPPGDTEKVLALCRQAGFTPEIAAEAEYTSAMLRYVSGGRGIAVLNRLSIPDGIGSVSIVDIAPPVYTRLYLLSPEKPASPAAAEFLRFMRNLTSE